MAHTEGPWNWTGLYVEDANGMAVAQVKCNGLEHYEEDGLLLATAPELLAELRAVVHLADVLNSRQHAGLPITKTMWGELYDICNRAKGVIAKTEAE